MTGVQTCAFRSLSNRFIKRFGASSSTMPFPQEGEEMDEENNEEEDARDQNQAPNQAPNQASNQAPNE